MKEKNYYCVHAQFYDGHQSAGMFSKELTECPKDQLDRKYRMVGVKLWFEQEKEARFYEKQINDKKITLKEIIECFFYDNYILSRVVA